MSRSRKSSNAMDRPNSQNQPEKKVGRVKQTLLLLWAFAGPALGTVGGVFLNDYFDVVKSNRDVAAQYSERAVKSTQEVSAQIEYLAILLDDPNSSVSTDDKVKMRKALLNLRYSVELLSFKMGVPDQIYQDFAASMANFANAVDDIKGWEDRKKYAEALSYFLMAQRNFEKVVARNYNPDLNVSWPS